MSQFRQYPATIVETDVNIFCVIEKNNTFVVQCRDVYLQIDNSFSDEPYLFKTKELAFQAVATNVSIIQMNDYFAGELN